MGNALSNCWNASNANMAMLSSLLLTTSLAGAVRAVSADLLITNRCTDTIWPAIHTQNGDGPSTSGFELESGDTRNLTVESNWNGRVWGRTNCTFDEAGNGRCLTGDCGGALDCRITAVPVTLAEFNLAGALDQSYYDISLVDGYNLPVAIEAILAGDAATLPPPNTTNPSCIAGAEGLAPLPFDPYTNGQSFLNTTSEFPLPFEDELSVGSVTNWCPRDLKMRDVQSGNAFVPCASPCDRYKLPIYCCTGKYGTADKCHANYYALKVKEVCPDAYGYAYDDVYSTFTAPTGSGFEVIFCPGGRSTNILRTLNPHAAGSNIVPSVALLMTAMLSTIVLSL